MSKVGDKELEQITSRLSVRSAPEIAAELAKKPADIQKRIFVQLSPKIAIETFDYLPLKIQTDLLSRMTTKQVAQLLEEMPPDDRTSLLQELPRKTVDEYIKLLPDLDRKLTLTLLGYPEDCVGHFMTTDYIAVKMNWSIEKVLEHIRKYGHDSETINVIFVIDDQGRLIRDVNIKDFLFVPKTSTVSQVAHDGFVAINANEKAEQAINVFKEYDRVALPVIDDQKKLIGIVTIDDILRLAAEESTEDMQKVAGLEALEEPYMQTPFLELMKKRSTWLVVLFIGELFTATAMGFFEQEIAQAVVLALFLPLIISSGGNAGSQSSTLIIRAMALGEVKLSDWWRVMHRELYSGLFLGCVLGIIGFIRVAAWNMALDTYGEHWLLIAITIFLSIIGVVLWGSVTGSMLPILLKKLGADPATSSAPLVATLVDVTGITIYFGIAMCILKGTLLH